MPRARAELVRLAIAFVTAAALVSPAAAADQLNAYSIWPENPASASWTAGSTRS